jgi:ketosteroid isomerase-like protein
MSAMEECWAETTDITCIHPGWGVLRGRDNVLQSWLAILANPESPKIVCRAPQVTVLGDSAVVINFEEIDGQYLLATNVYVQEAGRWRLVHHQAGPTGEEPAEETDDSGPPRVN